MHVQEPSVTMAAALMLHWESKDIEAVVVLLSEIGSQEEAEDIITALLMLRHRLDEELRELALSRA